MKKIIALLLAMTLCLGLFAGCGGGEQNPSSDPAENGLSLAKEYLRRMYKENDGTVVRRDFTRVAVVMIDGVSYDVTWTSDSSDVTVTAGENSTVTIDINEAPAEDVTFVLTATIKDAEGNTETVTFTHYIEAPEASGVVFVDAPVAGTAYKFAVVQNNLGQTLYFTGEMSGYYLATSESPFDAVDVYVEDVDGGQRIYFMVGETKTYIDIVPRGEDQPGKVNVVLTEDPTCVYTWDAERKTYTTTVEENPWYLGCYSSYNTMSASNTSYIENVEVIGESQFPAGMYTVEGYMELQPELGGNDDTTTGGDDDTTTGGDDDTTTGDPAADSTLSIADAIALGASKEHNTYTEGKYYVTGVITEVYNETYGNMYITDENGNVLTIYGTFDADGTNRYDAMATKPVAGDTVTIYGIIGQYNDTPQIKNGWITAHTPAGSEPSQGGDDDTTTGGDDDTTTGDPTADSTLSVSEAIALGASKEHNTYTEGKYYVTGVITEVYNETYGNMYITDDDGNILTIYGTFDADGTNRYDAMATKPVAGDTVTIYGIVGQYNGTPQIKNGWITAHTPGSSEPSQGDDDTTGGNTATDVTLENGTKVVIYAPVYGKALSSKPAYDGAYYQMGVNVTMNGDTLTGYSDTEVWTVVVNADGSYSFAQNGQNLGMQDEYSSMSLGAVNDDWNLISLGNGMYLIQNVARENYIEWYSAKDNWSTYTTTVDAGNDLFYMAFYIVTE